MDIIGCLPIYMETMELEMSKLFNLKEWLTLEDAAKHLSISFGEDVSIADVLRLGLDEHLRLSVSFVNHAKARYGKVITVDEVVYREPIIDLFPELKGITIADSLNLGDERYLRLDDETQTITGVWDLAMVGAECLDLEHMYQLITDGPRVTLECMDGAFVEGEDGSIWQLQDRFDDILEHHEGTQANFEKIKDFIANNDVGEEESKKLVLKHKKERMKYLLDKKAPHYYPAGSLPEDSALVVRTEALREFERYLSEKSSEQKQDNFMPESEKSSLLKLVLGMAVASYGYDPKEKRNSASGDNSGSIADSLAAIGLNIDSDTVRKYLKEAKELYADKDIQVPSRE